MFKELLGTPPENLLPTATHGTKLENGVKREPDVEELPDVGTGPSAAEPEVEVKADPDEDEAVQERRAWYKYTLAKLRGFLLRYYEPISPLAARIENEMFAEGAAPAPIRRAVREALHP